MPTTGKNENITILHIQLQKKFFNVFLSLKITTILNTVLFFPYSLNYLNGMQYLVLDYKYHFVLWRYSKHIIKKLLDQSKSTFSFGIDQLIHRLVFKRLTFSLISFSWCTSTGVIKREPVNPMDSPWPPSSPPPCPPSSPPPSLPPSSPPWSISIPLLKPIIWCSKGWACPRSPPADPPPYCGNADPTAAKEQTICKRRKYFFHYVVMWRNRNKRFFGGRMCEKSENIIYLWHYN